jgi:hypothetical protein
MEMLMVMGPVEIRQSEIQQSERRQEQAAGARRTQQLTGIRQSRTLTCDAFVVKLHSSASLLKKMVLVTKVVAALPLRSAERLCLSVSVFIILEAPPSTI